tara:strand:+ start:27 stop:290 length:264 start_codon:yes stop_codon:yes gene_type:complete
MSQTLSIVLKIIAFTILAVAGYSDLKMSHNTIFQDPFFVGAAVMAFASFMTLLNPSVYYIHTGMFFFIFTKIVSQITHSKHYDFWGR